MDSTFLIIFLIAVAVGGYLQTVTGFALGLVVMGVVGTLHLANLPMTAVVISLIAFINSAAALSGSQHLVRVRWGACYLLGIVPGVVVGVTLLTHMSAAAQEVLRWLLGGFLIVAAGLMAIRPQPKATPSVWGWRVLAGSISGFFNGLFSTGGPPIVFHLYRQPFAIGEIRATLLAVFCVSTMVRTVYVGVHGGITYDALLLTAISLPVALGATFLGRRFPLPLSADNARRFAFVLLAGLGTMVLL